MPQKKMKQGRHASSLKRARQAVKRTARNTQRMSAMRTAMKKVRKAVAEKNKTAAVAALQVAKSVIAKTAGKGTLEKRTSSRYISRLSLAVNSIQA